MKRLFLLEFRKNRRNIFLYLAAMVAILYQGIGLLGSDFAMLTGSEALGVVRTNLFTTYLLSGAVLSYIIVKDFEVGLIKEYFFMGYTRKEIYTIKYLYLLCKGNVIINLTVFGMVLWKSMQNQYGLKISATEFVFWLKIAAGNLVACFLFFAILLLCVVIIGNVLSLVLYFVGISFLDIIALFLTEKYAMPKWISIRYLAGCFYNRSMPWAEFAAMLVLMLGMGGIFLWVGELVFRGKEYR